VTDIRITTMSAAYDWDYCPRCGARLQLDQSPDDLVWTDDGPDEDKSEANGFSFSDSVKHCGFHIRLWQAVSDYDEVIQ
jgi:hypothetical protein